MARIVKGYQPFVRPSVVPDDSSCRPPGPSRSAAPGGKIRVATQSGRVVRASTLVEVIVASVVFLTIFAISMHTVTQLSINPREGEDFALADCLMRSCIREFSDGRREEGEYERTYDRVQVTITVAQYRDYEDLQELTVSTVVNRKRIEYKHIIERENEY
jgi:hypothetical protein